MRTPTSWIAGALLVGAALSGCSEKQPAENRASSPPAAESAAPAPAASHEGAATTPGSEGAPAGEVQLAGVLGCGHCNFHVTPECAAVVKTAGGDFYVLDGVGEGSELWEKRFEGTRQITVTGTIMGTDTDADTGTKQPMHLAMTSYELK